jgi:hypothetical protein
MKSVNCKDSMSKPKSKSKHQLHGEEQRKKIAKLYVELGGRVADIARAANLARSTVWEHLQKLGIKKPIAGGKQRAAETKESLPNSGTIKRYILTSAQNNTYVHEAFWANVLALKEHYDAKLLVGTFSYNQNNFGKLAVKRDKKNPYEDELWFDPKIAPYINDNRIVLAPGLKWCGNMNILPTEDNPISGLETYEGESSVIFPHTKIEMRSIATMPGTPVKFIYTTGAVTLMNYLQKKLGIKAEHHHRYACLVVEVDGKGDWWVRQVAARKNGRNIQDLNVVVEDGKVVSTDARVAAITWGDLHATNVEPTVMKTSLSMLDTLRPEAQYLHDVMEGVSVNRHFIKHAPKPHEYFHRWLRGLHRVDEELKQSKEVLVQYLRPWCKTYAPDANHDAKWLSSWLEKFDYRYDPANAEIFLRMQSFMFAEIRAGKMPKNVNLMQYAFEKEAGLEPGAVKFLLPDESSLVGDIECGCHGHLGSNGKFGNPSDLAKIGRKANTAHTHAAGIYHGLFVAGTSSKLTDGWSYTSGPSSWSWTHTLVYPNGQRTLVTLKNGKWRA